MADCGPKKCETCVGSCSFSTQSTMCARSASLPAAAAAYDGPNESKEQWKESSKEPWPTNPFQDPTNNLEETTEAVLTKGKNTDGKGSSSEDFVDDEGKIERLGNSRIGDTTNACKDSSTANSNADALPSSVTKTGDGANDDGGDEPCPTQGDGCAANGGILDAVRDFLGETTEKSESVVAAAAESGKTVAAEAGEVAANALGVAAANASESNRSAQAGNSEVPVEDCEQPVEDREASGLSGVPPAQESVGNSNNGTQPKGTTSWLPCM